MIPKKNDDSRKYKLGTRFKNSLGGVFQYAKIDFGVVGTIKSKKVRHVAYAWFPRNAIANDLRKAGQA